MAKYSNPVSPRLAAALYDGMPGNYVRHHRDGSAYTGRQGPGVRRISTHVRNNPDLIAVQFMHDHKGDPKVRATREFQTLARLQDDGVPVRNRIAPSMPRDSGGAGGILVAAGIVGIAGLLLAAFAKKNKAPAQ